MKLVPSPGEAGGPLQIERVERDAVSADARARVEGHVSERLRGGGLDHFPDVDADGSGYGGQLVRERDVHPPERVLNQLRHLGGPRIRDGMNLLHEAPVDRRRRVGADRRRASDDARDVRRSERKIPGVDALRRIGKQEILVQPEAARFEDGQHDVLRRAGVGRGLEDDGVAGPQRTGDAPRGFLDVGHVRLLSDRERRGDAYEQHVAVPEVLRRRREPRPSGRFGEILVAHIVDVRSPGLERSNGIGVDVEAGDVDPSTRHRDDKGEADVAEAEHGRVPRPAFEGLEDLRTAHEYRGPRLQPSTLRALDLGNLDHDRRVRSNQGVLPTAETRRCGHHRGAYTVRYACSSKVIAPEVDDTMKVLLVAGARPNFMKVAPVMRALETRGGESILVHTGQHYDPGMSDAFFADLDLPEPDIHLEVGSGSHAVQTARVMERLEPVIEERGPDIVVVVGDVNSTLAGALVAAKLGVPVAHVEAGLRSFDRTMPEEVNRVLTDQISDLLFTTSPEAAENLLREGVRAESIHFVGNPMIDSLERDLARARSSEVTERLGLEPIRRLGA